MRLMEEIDLGEWKATFVTLGDLDGDGQVEFLLSYYGPYSAHLRLGALKRSGELLWEVGDRSVRRHASGSKSDMATPCRGICGVQDVDGDGRAEVVAEFWNDGKPELLLLDGATGEVRERRASPFDMSVREPEGYSTSRPVPLVFFARVDGPSHPPAIVLKYEASNRVPPLVAALDSALRDLWQLRPKLNAVSHGPAIADLNGDGREEIVLGELAVDGRGRTLFEKDFGSHADMIDVFRDAQGRRRVLVSVCNHGPAHCLAADGSVVWSKTREEVPHGQAIWAGNFLPERPGVEAIVLRSGHVGDFVTLDGETGEQLAKFQHRTGLEDAQGCRKYPDMPAKVRWATPDTDALWIPADREVVDGRGRVLAGLGERDAEVAARLHVSHYKHQLAAQAIAVDLAGDARDELVLYQPYHGETVYIFSQADGSAEEKPYVHRAEVYNRKSYF